ncbi:hypothetical protein [Vibrio phage vB_VmeM-Yong XC32]|nr:hypothetical protein [Vibrio phage vB_VmeM-Yong XC31]QAX96613.1 hypothetical protein [Vibrio phage vB_VmeM-Yong XC32]QAX96931.1 hypothetical protein [Vibrio phage vB_VmeM-Yong MS31]QAX97236.1 hypothetical protein [Vibrio phage vB_VmeM-Yong MS32]
MKLAFTLKPSDLIDVTGEGKKKSIGRFGQIFDVSSKRTDNGTQFTAKGELMGIHFIHAKVELEKQGYQNISYRRNR